LIFHKLYQLPEKPPQNAAFPGEIIPKSSPVDFEIEKLFQKAHRWILS
jgi:hypothetical protein